MSGPGIFFLAAGVFCGALLGACIAGIQHLFSEAGRTASVFARALILLLVAVGLAPVAMSLFLAVIACAVAAYKLG